MSTNNTTAANIERLTLKSLKTVKWLSQETTCFTATVLIDGKVIGEAVNDGNGGCTFVRCVSPAAEATADQFAKSINPADVSGWEFLSDRGFTIDCIVDIVVGRMELKKETARIVAKIRRDAVKKAQFIKTTTKKGFVACFKGVNDLNRCQAVAKAISHPEFKMMVADMTDAQIAEWFIA